MVYWMDVLAALHPTTVFQPYQYDSTPNEITSQTDLYLVILSSKTYVFEDKLIKYYPA